jgi:hypothetical protein
MCGLWQADYDRLEEAARQASARERSFMDAKSDARSDAERQFLAAAKIRDDLLDKLYREARAISRTKARSFQGAAAKLGVVIRENQPSAEDPTPPWPCLRSVLNDLNRLIAATKPA